MRNSGIVSEKSRLLEQCRQLGYQGRQGIYELLLLNETIRPLILNRSAATTIASKAMEMGMRTLRTDGWNKVKAGRTTASDLTGTLLIIGPVANGAKRSFCLEQTSCEQFDIASDQSPMVSVIGRGGYCYECRQRTLARQGKEKVLDDAR